MAGFFDSSKTVENTIAAAEADLNKAIEQERPDEIGATIPETPKDKKGFADDAPAGDGTNWQKRYGDLQRWVDKKLKPEYQAKVDILQKNIDDLNKKVQDLVSKGTPENLPQSVAEIEGLKKDAPAAYSAIVALATSIAEGIVNDRVSSLHVQFEEVSKVQKKNSEQAAMLDLMGRHPDFNQISGDEQFHGWLEKQPKTFQDAIYKSFDATDLDEAVNMADAVLKAYKVAHPPAGKKGKKKDGAERDVNVPSSAELPSGNKTWEFTESQIAAMNGETFTRHSEAIEKALRENRVLYDITDKVGTAQRMAAQAA